jgi:hypothetical protein
VISILRPLEPPSPVDISKPFL